MRDWIGIVCVLLGMAVTSFGIGLGLGENMERERAVKAGVGRWTIDATTGDKHFEYGTTTEGK